ncbi:DUF1028 domain-containing protein [bacterium]|nr:DUF1028 domain-containing protein [bacterium]
MRRWMRSATLAFALATTGPTAALATFSIVAVDPATGEVGSAGASCISGAIILSDVHPGTGTVHTQAYWRAQNQNYARSLMNQGFAPQAIIDSLVAHDDQGNPTIRQYVIVDLVGGGRTAGYTGVNCTDYKNHRLGPTYAVAGNILLGAQILDGMEQAFLNTPGPLSDRLMAALQAANVAGADTRCTNKPAISAFLRVAKPGDPASDLFLDLNINNTSFAQNPIDLLQNEYDSWKSTVTTVASSGGPAPPRLTLRQNTPNPFTGTTSIRFEVPRSGWVKLSVYDVAGRRVADLLETDLQPAEYAVPWDRRDASGQRVAGGLYFYRITVAGESLSRRMVVLR